MELASTPCESQPTKKQPLFSPFHCRESGCGSSDIVIIVVGNHVHFLSVMAWILCGQPTWRQQRIRGKSCVFFFFQYIIIAGSKPKAYYKEVKFGPFGRSKLKLVHLQKSTPSCKTTELFGPFSSSF